MLPTDDVDPKDELEARCTSDINSIFHIVFVLIKKKFNFLSKHVDTHTSNLQFGFSLLNLMVHLLLKSVEAIWVIKS